jgi:hypothetical protein
VFAPLARLFVKRLTLPYAGPLALWGSRLKVLRLSLALFASLIVVSEASAADGRYGRLPLEKLDVTPPSERVRGTAGQMTVRQVACRTLPVAETRQRIVDVAVQEWGYFGFPIVDYTTLDDEVSFGFGQPRRRGPFPALPQEEAVRVAASVAGYWAATPSGPQMIARQNQEWSEPWGVNGRWADPWSAAFISWVMCESGLGESSQFQRAIAHWTYIDQSIRARDGGAPAAGFVAYDVGEQVIAPGDLLCSSRRPAYRSIADRRRQLGIGARAHCDIVVKVDEPGNRIFAIGGNVRRSVSLKLFPTVRTPGKTLRPVNISGIDDERPLFAHLKLRAPSVEANALDNTPTIKALDCVLVFEERHPAYGLTPASVPRRAC